MNAITEIVPAVPEAVVKAIKLLAIEMRIESCLTDIRIESGTAPELEEHQRWRVTEALEALERSAGLRS
jgi:hypothetical protein